MLSYLLKYISKIIKSNSPSYLLDLFYIKQSKLSLHVNDKQLLIIPPYNIKRYGYHNFVIPHQYFGNPHKIHLLSKHFEFVKCLK